MELKDYLPQLFTVTKNYEKLKKDDLKSFSYNKLWKDMGLAFKIWRLKAGYRSDEVAKRAGIPSSSLSNIEAGRGSMRLKDLYKICKYNSIDLSIHINGEEIKLWDFSMWSHWTAATGQMVELRMAMITMMERYGGKTLDDVALALMDYQDSIDAGIETPSVVDYCKLYW